MIASQGEKATMSSKKTNSKKLKDPPTGSENPYKKNKQTVVPNETKTPLEALPNVVTPKMIKLSDLKRTNGKKQEHLEQQNPVQHDRVFIIRIILTGEMILYAASRNNPNMPSFTHTAIKPLISDKTKRDKLKISYISRRVNPDNPNYPSYFHVRNDGWMGASLTFDGPREIKCSEPLHLRYGLYVHSDMKPSEAIETEWKRFTQISVVTSQE